MNAKKTPIPPFVHRIAALLFAWPALMASQSLVAEAPKLVPFVEELSGEWETYDLPEALPAGEAVEYANPVLVAGPPTRNGTHPVIVRIRNIDPAVDPGTGKKGTFEAKLQAWDYLGLDPAEDLPTEQVSFLVMEEGVHEIDGITWQAAVVGDDEAMVDHNVQTVYFEEEFEHRPALFGQVVTENEPDAVTHRFAPESLYVFNLNELFRVKFQEEEGKGNREHVGEIFHYIAVDLVGWGASEGSIAAVNPVDPQDPELDNVLPFRAAITHPFFEGTPIATHEDLEVTHNDRFTTPAFFADISSYNDRDPVTVRLKRNSARGATIFLEEEDSAGNGTDHAPEKVEYLVFSTEVDTDRDGLSDQTENNFNNLFQDEIFDLVNVNEADIDASGDGISILDALEAGFNPWYENGLYRVTAIDGEAYEKEGGPARFRITRELGTNADTIQIDFGGNAAFGADYTISAEADGYPNASATQTTAVFEQGQAALDIVIHPVSDSDHEYPERVILGVQSYAQGDPEWKEHKVLGAPGLVAINDATDIPENEKFFLGIFEGQPQPPVLGGTPVGTNGTGYAVIKLNGPNTRARVSSVFEGLEGEQHTPNNSHIHMGTNDPATSGTPVQGLPYEPFTDRIWNIDDTSEPDGQAIVDALFGQGQNGEFLYINVHTPAHSAGEIWAPLSFQSTDPYEPPEDPGDPEPNLSASELERDVARFLTQATFGPTREEIDALVDEIQQVHGNNRIDGYAAWIDDQFNDGIHPAASHQALTYALDSQEFGVLPTDRNLGYNQPDGAIHHRNRRIAWWTIASQAKDQLRQRVGFALSEIFVIADHALRVRQQAYGAAHYYDMLVGHADGNYRDLIADVSKHPLMGYYLSHLKNRKEVIDSSTGEVLVFPDENYAREIMQLFSIGLIGLEPDGSPAFVRDENGEVVAPVVTYSNEDIKELARVFTGWGLGKRDGASYSSVEENHNFYLNGGKRYGQAPWTHPMKNFSNFHDDGLDHTPPKPKNVLGATIPAGQTGQQDLDAALDILYHHNNLGPFLARRMIQRLTHSNPSRGYVYRVARAFENGEHMGLGSGQRGDFGAMVKAILLDPEVRDLALAAEPDYGKQKEPIIRYVQLLRAFESGSQLEIADLTAFDMNHDGDAYNQVDRFIDGATQIRHVFTNDHESRQVGLGQSPLDAPSVFNWFLPDYQPGILSNGDKLFVPEMQLTDETRVIQFVNFVYRLLDHGPDGRHRSVQRFTVDFQSGERIYAPNSVHAYSIEDFRSMLEYGHEAYYNASGGNHELAARVVVDSLDDLLMAGNLRATYGPYVSPEDPSNSDPNARDLIIKAVADTELDGTTFQSRRKVRNALYLICTSPEFLHQK